MIKSLFNESSRSNFFFLIYKISEKKSFFRSYIWEIMKNTINKVISRVKQVTSKLETLTNPAIEKGSLGVDITSEGNDCEINFLNVLRVYLDLFLY